MDPNGTTFEFVAAGKAHSSDVLMVPLVIDPPPALSTIEAVDAVCEGAVSELLRVRAVGKDPGALAHTTRAGGYGRIVVVGLGSFDKLTDHRIRQSAAAVARWLVAEKISNAALWIHGLETSGQEHATGEWTLGMRLAGWRFQELRKRNGDAPSKIRVQLRAPSNEHIQRVQPDVREAGVIADAVNYARRLAHQPPNIINPATLAEEARRLARGPRIKCTILETPQLRKLRMNGLLSVGQGAKHGPRLIVLEYRPLPKSKLLTVLVGKAITFDTGGYSIKTSGMETMKFDKSGGTTVLGILKAMSELRLTSNVVAVIAAAENSISAEAYRPGDIVRMANGKTVEVTNTDAEGRMVLADALWYAQQHYKPTQIIDYATLTGGVVTALGSACAGLMTNDDRLAGELEECGRKTHERLWRLPLWDEYADLIKSTDADLKNAALKRHAHPIVGGIFLKQFVAEKTPWAHLDIAGTATDDDGKTITGHGATGFGIRLTLEYLRRYAS